MKYDTMEFNGFRFPLLPSLIYQADGPDKSNPDRLFVRDAQERFMFYFEVGYDSIPELSKNDYERMEIICEGRHFIMFYPKSAENQNRHMGYFMLETGSDSCSNTCCGQLSVYDDESYFNGLLEFPEFYRFVTGIESCCGK